MMELRWKWLNHGITDDEHDAWNGMIVELRKLLIAAIEWMVISNSIVMHNAYLHQW